MRRLRARFRLPRGRGAWPCGAGCTPRRPGTSHLRPLQSSEARLPEVRPRLGPAENLLDSLSDPLAAHEKRFRDSSGGRAPRRAMKLAKRAVHLFHRESPPPIVQMDRSQVADDVWTLVANEPFLLIEGQCLTLRRWSFAYLRRTPG